MCIDATNRILELGLPPIKKYTPFSASFQYGASELLRRYCKTRYRIPPSTVRWIHGWMPKSRQFDHRFFTSMEVEIPRSIFVSRPDEKTFLEKAGFNSIHVVGLPYCYVPPIQTKRLENSLLVMPAHTLKDVTCQWRFDEYVDQIDSIRPAFEQVAVCVHPACITNGYWAPEFSRRGYTVIPGAAADDENAMLRMKTLFSSFSHITTNQLGSHVVYAAATGAHVSIFGNYAEWRYEDLVNVPFYVQNPGLVEPLLEVLSEAAVRADYPFLFTHPSNFQSLVDWGQTQIGMPYLPGPDELRKLMHWTILGQLVRKGRRLYGRLSRTKL